MKIFVTLGIGRYVIIETFSDTINSKTRGPGRNSSIGARNKFDSKIKGYKAIAVKVTILYLRGRLITSFG